MKKFLFAFFIALCSWGAVGDVYTGDPAKAINVKYNWSYGALAEVMKLMRPQCEPTTKFEFLEMGNWFREKNARFSFYELMHQCVTQYKKFQNIVRTDNKKCELPPPCDPESLVCNEKDYTDISGCNIFITTLLEHNNASVTKNDEIRTKILASGKAGTYVTQAKTPDGKLVYRIFDVILANGYWKDGQINNEINNDEKNTTIWDVTSGTPVDTKLKTWTNDMFFSVEATSNAQGSVGGAFVNSYIFPYVDLTNDIYSLYDKRRGSTSNTVGNTWDSRQGGPFDIKVKYAAMYNMPGQIETETHSNAAIFNGKVAHFDWLGHLLFGMNRQESALPHGLADEAAQALSIMGNKDFWKWSFIAGATRDPSAYEKLDEAMKVEPLNMQNAWDVGSSLVEQAVSQRITTFETVVAPTRNEAYQKAAQEMKKIYPNANNISCTGNCNPVGSIDIVICTDSLTTDRAEFVFKSICGEKQNLSDPYSGAYFRPGMR